ncbi:hypothetical protein DSM07_08440 [Oenococcus sp. UCMA 16435]|nr:hypothetical protein DSM07_08440 [Oenococcus sp. UCMA 16435]MDN6968576.1 hypothetical protein [Oenococcus sp. UCMA 17063]
MGFPTVYPTGVTVYDPNTCQNGYTVINIFNHQKIIDMNGNEVTADFSLAEKSCFEVQHNLNTSNGFSSLPILDSQIVQKDAQNHVVWQWTTSEHFKDFHFNATAENAIYRLIQYNSCSGWSEPWLAIDNVKTIGENEWFDEGDRRFDPKNILFSAPNANILGIIDHLTGQIIWQLGPTFTQSEALRALGCLINPEARMIAQGLPGAGNLLIFDHGGSAGYGSTNGMSPDGIANEHRDFSRILEVNPMTLSIEWQYTPEEAHYVQPLDAYKVYSKHFGNVQRLNNGNTLINEGDDGRIYEITPDYNIIWEYINPDRQTRQNGIRENTVLDSKRIEYAVLNTKQPTEIAVPALNVTNLRVPGSPNGANKGKVTIVDGVDPTRLKAVRNPHTKQEATQSSEHDFCVVTFGTNQK